MGLCCNCAFIDVISFRVRRGGLLANRVRRIMTLDSNQAGQHGPSGEGLRGGDRLAGGGMQKA